MIRLAFAAALSLGLAACSPSPNQADTIPPNCRPPVPFTVRHPGWATRASLYQVNIRQYTPEGTFRAFEPHLPRLQRAFTELNLPRVCGYADVHSAGSRRITEKIGLQPGNTFVENGTLCAWYEAKNPAEL